MADAQDQTTKPPADRLRERIAAGGRISQADLDAAAGQAAGEQGAQAAPEPPPPAPDQLAAAAAQTSGQTDQLLSWDQQPVVVSAAERASFERAISLDQRFTAEYPLPGGGSVVFRTRTLRETAALNAWLARSTHYQLFPKDTDMPVDMWLHAALLVMCVQSLNGRDYPVAEKPLQLLVRAPEAPADKPVITQLPGWLRRVDEWFDRGAVVHLLIELYVHFERVYWTLLKEGRRTDFPWTAGAS